MRSSLGWILFGWRSNAAQRGARGNEGEVVRAKGKDSCRSTKQLILSPGGIFYGRYNLQDASLKATRVYQRKLAPLHPRSPFRDPSFVSRRIFLFRLRLTVGLFLFNSSRALRRCNFFRDNFYRRFHSPLPLHRFRIYLSKISRIHLVTPYTSRKNGVHRGEIFI